LKADSKNSDCDAHSHPSDSKSGGILLKKPILIPFEDGQEEEVIRLLTRLFAEMKDISQNKSS
jgi:hypothetical protein